jgi:hypothetical protein
MVHFREAISPCIVQKARRSMSLITHCRRRFDQGNQTMLESEIGHNSIVTWSTDAVATEVNDEIVLMNLERDRCYGLGSTGSDIWRRLREPIQVSDLVTQLWSEYDSAPGQIESDVLRTLNEFAAEGLIQVSTTRG